MSVEFIGESTISVKCKTCKLLDFKVIEQDDLEDGDKFYDIQMFGIDEKRRTYSITVKNFKPFFYIKIPNSWDNEMVIAYMKNIKSAIGYSEKFIIEYDLVKYNKLYGFDGKKLHNFIKITCENMSPIYSTKRLFYDGEKQSCNEKGYVFENESTYIYETQIPPMLRFFHIQEISPSGWVMLKNVMRVKNKKTKCNFEYNSRYQDIISLPDKEIGVNYKVCSFDIEASSSHGDFPLAKKNYNKVAYDIINYMDTNEYNYDDLLENIEEIMENVFGFSDTLNIDHVYLKDPKSFKREKISTLLKEMTNQNITKIKNDDSSIMSFFDRIENKTESSNDVMENEDKQIQNFNEDNAYTYSKKLKFAASKENNIFKYITNNEYEKVSKVAKLSSVLNTVCHALGADIQGDKVTFIGSTFMNFNDEEPYLNHCVVLDECSDVNQENTEIEYYDNEKDVLLAWTNIINREDPDIIIGYNIFGFDYSFMIDRADENKCLSEFAQFSRNNFTSSTPKESSVVLAAGQFDIKYIETPGRIQIDMYNYFRRDFNLSSYKLDNVAAEFLSDKVSKIDYDETTNTSKVYTKNVKGLNDESFVRFEILDHSNTLYNNGEKFQLTSLDKGYFTIIGKVETDKKYSIKWSLAKDDVSPQDIFRLTNEGPNEKAIIAKYCIQDCNLVHYLFKKIDVMTTYIEMSKICSVPISFLVFRGQGIKLTSYIAKKCREKNTLMPLISKGSPRDAYEGAIVLDPKCDLYLTNPVACVDYSSLYPSSIISENLSHDSKVWTKEYDLNNNIIKETGEKDKDGNYIYDNLEEYSYVDIKYETFEYVRTHPNAAAKKVSIGYKICRFAQFKEGKAIMPSILEELLAARKATKKQMKKESDPFMQNILDKRQLSIKVTANSLYGQCGAKTSTFYEMDVAASTTATGRKLLHYAKEVIENVYTDMKVDTKYGPMLTNAEYVYGDSVTGYTPIYIKNNDIVSITCIEDIGKKYGENNWKTCIEPGKQEKEYIDISDKEVYTWTESKWTKLNTIIRHKLAKHKNIVRILTHTGCVDVTDDHSLLDNFGVEVSPKECEIGNELLHSKIEITPTNNNISKEEAMIMGFFFGDGSCGRYECPSGIKCSWALNNKSTELINKYFNLCKKVYPEFEWIIYDTIKSSNVYKLSFKGENKKEFIEHYRNILYSGNKKIIPTDILNSHKDIKEAFLEGVYDADGDKKSGNLRIDQKSQLSVACLFTLIQSLGYNVSINDRSDKPNIYRLNYSKNYFRKNTNTIKKMYQINDYDDYVYDLTTENHHFAAGIGNMIVHNTDSVFFTFNLKDPETGKAVEGQEALEVTIEMAKEAGELATKFLKGPHDLEYEKTFMPFCLLSKKRYVGMLYEEDPNYCKRKSMGIVLKRRDNAPIVKDVYGGIIDILMNEKDLNMAKQYLYDMLDKLVSKEIPIEKLIISKSLRAFYKNPKQIAHKALADRIAERDPGNKPAPGDRIPFVYIVNKNKKALQGDKIELPTYIKENKIKIDYLFYISNQIMKPVTQLFALVLYKMDEFKRKKQAFINKLNTMRQNLEPEKYIKKEQDLKNKEIEKILFEKYLIKGKHMKEGTQSISSFFNKI